MRLDWLIPLLVSGVVLTGPTLSILYGIVRVTLRLLILTLLIPSPWSVRLAVVMASSLVFGSGGWFQCPALAPLLPIPRPMLFPLWGSVLLGFGLEGLIGPTGLGGSMGPFGL